MIKSLMLWTRGCKSLKNIHICRIGLWKPWIRKLPGSSMVEVVVSMTLLLTILTLALVALNRINNSVNPGALYKAHLVTSDVLSRADLLLEEMEEYQVEGFLVKKSIALRKNGMYQVELSVVNGYGKTIYTRKILKSNGINL